MPDNIYVAKIVDKDGNSWLFERYLKGEPIWVEEALAHPLYMNEVEAEDIAKTNLCEGDRWEVVRMF